MEVARYRSAYRLGLGIVLVYVLFELAGGVVTFTSGVVQGRRTAQAVGARNGKMAAPALEALLRASKLFPPASQVKCAAAPAPRDWDYVCSYMPTPAYSQTRLQMGFNVDANSWTQVSPRVPLGTILPAPQKY